MVQTAGHALLRSWTAMETRVSSSVGFECQWYELAPMGQAFKLPIQGMLRWCVSDTNWCPWGKRSNSPYRACSDDVSVIRTGAHGASVQTPPTGHAQMMCQWYELVPMGQAFKLPLQGMLRWCVSDTNWCPWGKRSNSPYRACSDDVSVIWTGAHGASVQTPPTGHAQMMCQWYELVPMGQAFKLPLQGMLRWCVSDMNWCPWGKRSNSPYRACSG